MIRINLLKPGVMVYDTPEPGGIIDIEKLESTRKIKPCLFEVVWDKEDYESKMAMIKKLKTAGKRASHAGEKLHKIMRTTKRNDLLINYSRQPIEKSPRPTKDEWEKPV